MARKRKTLPKNFKELIESKDLAALKDVFDACEISAYSGFNKDTALHFYHVPGELARWLVAQGADVNAREHYGRTPLHVQATVGSDSVGVLLELGADVQAKSNYGDTPLHMAAGYHRDGAVRALVAHGADIHAKNKSGQTPLSYGLDRCRNIGISSMAVISEFLLSAGAEITPDMAESVERIGKQFEFSRADFNKDYLAETDLGLMKLYALFNVAPVARRQMHDGTSPIRVPDGKWHEQHDVLWQFLVPGSGPAQTVQGEVIRLSGRLAREIMGNGGGNWDADFRKMLDALVKHFASGTPLGSDELEEAANLAKRLRGGIGDDEPGRLMELAVHWVKENPNPAPLGKPEYGR